MDRRIWVLAVVLVLCFVVLLVQLSNLQVARAPQLLANPDQVAEQVAKNPFQEPRGDIVSADGSVIAETNRLSDSVGEQRVYPMGPLFADVSGYYDAVDFTATAVEGRYNTDLSEHTNPAGSLREILTEQSGTDNVVLTVRADLQRVAAQALGGELGAIVALDPRTGAVLAMYGNPTFNPNDMASHRPAVVKATYKSDYTSVPLAEDAPLTNQVTDHTFAPGSTMKVITIAAIFDHDPVLAAKVWPDESETKLPDSDLLLHNFGSERCGGKLLQILTVSCDTAHALIGVALGPQNLADEAGAFGFNKVPPIDLDNVFGDPDAVAPSFPSPAEIPGAFAAYSAIGQMDDQQSVLGNALVAAAIANGGVIMAPHVMAHVLSATGAVVSSYQPHAWLEATSSTTSDAVRTDLLNVALAGTASGLFPPSDDVAAKTGTAETLAGCTANWLIATAPAEPDDTPRVAVAAVIPAQSGVACNDESVTGATVAGPVVAKVLVAALLVTS